jgi:PHD/YefM family antitoxin component YafN of YafNO toxin-antitoxin module
MKPNPLVSIRIKVSAAEFQRNIGRYQEMALTEPVAVTRNGRERTVMISTAEYMRLKRLDRAVLGLDDFSDEGIAALEATRAPVSSKAFDHELDDAHGFSRARARLGYPLQLSVAIRTQAWPGGGPKDRPCAIVLSSIAATATRTVTVLPITHTPPGYSGAAVEIPLSTKQRLGLDDARSWVILTEANRFICLGPDLRPARRGDAGSVVCGQLPYRLFEEIRLGFLNAIKGRRLQEVHRSQ